MIAIIKRLVIVLLFFVSAINAQRITVEKIEPPNWWTGMKWNNIQLMVYGENLNGISAASKNQHLRIDSVYSLENPDYTFIDVTIDPGITPGNYALQISNGISEADIVLPILSRVNSADRNQGFSKRDVIYLITPDRFANADVTNDSIPGYYEEFPFRHHLGRHGGDIAGIISKLDYIQDLGVKAIWINPLVENNMFISYHGYSATDFYRIDPRFGNNKLFKQLVEEAHKRGLKVIWDHVSNHIADNHRWAKNLPTMDWLNGSRERHKNAIHNKSLLPDPYSSEDARIQLTDGWFADYMPDLNQRNLFVRNYIIQNTIWWLEYAGIDGIREDTYPYADQKFLAKWASAILDEYPKLNIVGEVWDGNPATLAWYQNGIKLNKSFDSHLPVVTDFNLTYAFGKFLKNEAGLDAFYHVFSQDFVYRDPNNLLTFIDNHDILRAAYLSNGINKRLKMAYSILLTTRGIPQLYYGSEIGLRGGTDHGEIRETFPGGFPFDKRSAFEKEYRNPLENDLFNHIKQLLELRIKYPALTVGKLIHFEPYEGVYIYFRIAEDQNIVIICNSSDQTKEFTKSEFSDWIDENSMLYNLFDQARIKLESSIISVPSLSTAIIEIR